MIARSRLSTLSSAVASTMCWLRVPTEWTDAAINSKTRRSGKTRTSAGRWPAKDMKTISVKPRGDGFDPPASMLGCGANVVMVPSRITTVDARRFALPVHVVLSALRNRIVPVEPLQSARAHTVPIDEASPSSSNSKELDI